MSTLPHRFWHEMTTVEFRSIEAARTIAILPVGAIEQHGPHLPVGVDTAINEAIVRRTLELLPAHLAVIVLPTLPVGKSNEHLAYPGTLSLSAETLLRLWMEIGEAVARAGIRKLLLLNSHGGQQQILDVVARDLRIRCHMLVIAVHVYQLGYPEGLFPLDEIRHGIHAGAVETSMMLHLAPDLVHRDACRAFPPLSVRLEPEFRLVGPMGIARFGWQAQDLHPDGACGDATIADATRGRALIEHTASRMVQVITEVDRLPIDVLKSGP